jgi:putative membrane protein
MIDLLLDLYPWNKSLHIMSVLSWMAGLFYLPRLYVYHVEKVADVPGANAIFLVMEAKLIGVIMRPAMISTWIFGLLLVVTPGIVDWSAIWPWVKAASVLAMTWFHHWLALRGRDFRDGRNQLTGRQFRMMNEVPTLLMILIVLAVVIKF